VLVRNPMNPRRISRISLAPEAVEALVFWTKDPRPMLENLPALSAYPFYFHFTLNAYGADIEPGLPPPPERAAAFQELSRRAGACRVIWRYDPILLNGQYTAAWHVDRFGALSRRLQGFTEKVTVSFLSFYQKIMKSVNELNIQTISREEKRAILKKLAAVAGEHGLALDTCAEETDFSDCGAACAHCIDARRIERISGRPCLAAKDKSQRPRCGCAASVDIGAYNSCVSGCRYCYANHSPETAARNRSRHDPRSPLLLGDPGPADTITDRSF